MEIKVKGMHCEHCERKVEKALEGLGLNNVKASHLENKVSFDETNVDIKLIKKTIKNIGFKA